MIPSKNLTLRRAAFDDARFLFALRTEPSVREASFSTGAISYASHAQWLRSKLRDKRILFLIAESDGTAIGQARFDNAAPNEAEMSVALIPAARGKGLGETLIRRASRECFRVFPRVLYIRARIKPDNRASLRSFEKAGYTRWKKGGARKNHCLELVLHRADRGAAPQMRIMGRTIGPGSPCFVVAELSGNHHQSYDEAALLVRAAKDAGADAVKLQTYTPDTMTLNSDKKWFRVGGKNNPKQWKGKTLYQLYSKTYTPWEWQPKLKKLADKLGIIFFSTPFDETAVDFLEGIRVPCYKIAAYEATDFVLLRRVAKTGKPVIISFGYASEEEIRFALDTLRAFGAREITALHCVTGYAKEPRLKDMRLANIADIEKRFGVFAGFSDNNAGIVVPCIAAAVGACIIEKHFTLDRSKGGPDARFSLEPREFQNMVSRIRAFERGAKRIRVPKSALGVPLYGPTSATEKYNMRWRRSLFAARDIKKGEAFTKENIRDIRPAFGLEAKYYDAVIGRRATRAIAFATPLEWALISW